VGSLIDTVLDLIGALAGTDKERAWHPLQVIGYALLAVVAVALLAAWLTS
jgi:hypothetical protein